MSPVIDYQREYDAMDEWANHQHEWKLDMARMVAVCRCGEAKAYQPLREWGSSSKDLSWPR